jgi:hypothetical protein
MTRLIVNDAPLAADPGAKTWGELLAVVDRSSQADGRVVTAVRLDGVDEPSFRDPAVCARTLADLAVVEVQTLLPAALLAETVREALDGVDSLAAFSLQVGRRFRGDDLQSAHEGLLELVQGLQVLTSLLATIGAVLQTDIRTLVADGLPVGPLLERIGSHLEALIAAQQAQDWLTLADVVEYDIEPALAACRPLFVRLSQTAAPQLAH